MSDSLCVFIRKYCYCAHSKMLEVECAHSKMLSRL
uniref:Uncharacterized protein n=1 Tax=Anguilla anguilla TaxID=7936 RepID=A0A0E9VHE7_ANGAN